MRQNEPDRHHYVPRMLLKRFADAGGCLHIFNKHRNIRYLGTPGSDFFVRGLYRDPNPPKNESEVWLETAFRAIETPTASLLDKVLASVEAGSPPAMTPQEKHLWDWFFALQFRRLPEIHDNEEVQAQVEKKFDEALDSYAQQTGTSITALKSLLTPTLAREITQSAKMTAIATPGRALMALLHGRGLAFLQIPTGVGEFVVGSMPLVGNDIDFRLPNSELWLPVSRQIAIGLGGDQANVANCYLLDDPMRIRAFNERIAVRSQLFAGGSATVIDELAAPFLTKNECE